MTLLSLSANYTVYLLTHDIALSFSQLHHVTIIEIVLFSLGQHSNIVVVVC